MAIKIKFGTDGWRAIIAQDFTVENVARVAEASADWLLSKNKNASVVIGNDCRFAGNLFAETTAKVMCSKGVKVKLAEGFVSTPMVSLERCARRQISESSSLQAIILQVIMDLN
ncbi:MAG: hypothetical protein R2829_07205 [Bacteroidia bacterium]